MLSEIAPTPVVPLDLPFELRVFTPIAEFGGMELFNLPRRFTPFWNAFVLLVMSRFVVLVRAIVGGWAIGPSWYQAAGPPTSGGDRRYW